jgi:hypothetical protein
MLEETIHTLERQFSGPVTDAERAQQQATLMFLGSLREMVKAFCLAGHPGRGEAVYIPFSMRD